MQLVSSARIGLSQVADNVSLVCDFNGEYQVAIEPAFVHY